MNLAIYGAFLAAVVVLIATPGPVVALVVAEAARHGRRVGAATVIGTTLGSAALIVLVVLGLAALVAAYAGAFEVVRWAGAGYLLWLGARSILKARTAGEPLPADTTAQAGVSFRRGLLVALSNPKTLLFHSAFLPMFVDPALPAAPQLAVLGASFVAVAFVMDMIWMLAAARVGAWLSRSSALAWLDRATGGVLIAGGVALAARRA